MSQESFNPAQTLQLLRTKFPGQGFDADDQMPEKAQVTMMMWVQIVELAKRGLFDRIRADVLVQHYANIRSIYDDVQGGVWINAELQQS